VHSRQTDKYTSINMKDGYIEFRSPGGDWLNNNFAEIDNTLRRFTVAMSAAVDPDAYRQEYLKKLYKLLDVSGEKDPLSYFAKYAAGELPKAALKSFVRQAQLERGVKRGKAQKPQGVDTRVDYELYSRASGAVIDTFPARNDDEAITRLSDYINFGAGQSNPDNFDVRRAGRAPIAGSTLDLQRQRATQDQQQGGTVDVATDQPAPQPAGMTQWNGQWRVLVGGREVYRFGNIGNSQADANRIAAAWLRSSGQGVSGEGFEVYPVMNESLTETNRLTLRDFNVKLSPHYRDRAHAKGVDLRRVDDVLFNLSKVKDKIMSLDPGRAFILHDGQGTGLGMRRHLGNRLTLATVYPVSPGFNKGLYPTFRVDTVMNEQGVAEELNFDEIYGKYLKVTDNSGDPGEPGFSLVTPLNGDSWNWRERPEFKDLVKQKLNDPGFLGDHKYQQIIDAMSGKQFDPTKHIAKENFADGKNPERKGLAKRSGVNTKASVSSLRKTAKNSSGEKQRMAHWLANMKAGRAKARRK